MLYLCDIWTLIAESCPRQLLSVLMILNALPVTIMIVHLRYPIQFEEPRDKFICYAKLCDMTFLLDNYCFKQNWLVWSSSHVGLILTWDIWGFVFRRPIFVLVIYIWQTCSMLNDNLYDIIDLKKKKNL